MTVASDAQLNRLRTRPHRSTLHLSIYDPNTALAAQINMAGIARGEREIDITILGGDFNTVKRGMTCYVGTTPSGQDVDRIRAISATSTQITIAENDLNLRDGMFLTVVWFYEPWAVFPRIVLDSDNIPLFYKDYDIEYSDQNQFHDPVVHMGPNHAMFLENTPTGSWASAWYTSSGTFDPTDDSIPTGFAWTFEGGTPTASFVSDPGYIEYTGAGHFLTSLEVVSNFGKSFTARRHVSVYTRPDQGPARPIVRWGMTSFEGARVNGGYSMRLWIREEADYARVVEGALIVIFTDDGQGAFEDAMGGNAENRSSILFNGYIEDESITINPVTNRLEFRVGSITSVMKRIAGFSATYESKVSGATRTWNEMTNMTVDKAMIAFLRWQSTILTIADYQPTGDTLDVQFMDFERSSVYDAINNLLASSLVATAVADRQGKIWTEIDANMRSTGSARNLDTAMSTTRQDWRSALDFQVHQDTVLSYLEMGGIAYPGPTTGTSDPFLAGAPGDAPAYFGGLERVSGLVIEGQTQINELVGLAWAKANQDFSEFLMPMAGDYRILDIAPQERVLVSLEEDDTWRGYVWDEKAFIPSSIQYSYQAGDQVLLQDVTLEEETDGPPGETVEISVDPPFPKFILPEIDLPPILLPPPIDPIPIDPPPGTGDLAYVIAGSYLTRTRNLLDPTPDWEDLTPPTSGANSVTGSYQSFILDPIDPGNRAYLITNTSGGDYAYWVYRIDNLDSPSPTFTQILSALEVATIIGGTANFQCSIYDVDVSPMNRNVVYAVGASQAIGSPSGYVLRSFDAGITWELAQWPAGFGRIQDSSNLIEASEHSIVSAYGVFGQFTTLQDRFTWSIDTYSTYTQIHQTGEYNDWHVPYQGNAADLGMYLSIGSGATKILYYSENRGIPPLTDISPTFLGELWACNRGPGGPFGKRQRQIETHPSNRLFVAALLQKKVAEPIDDETVLFISTTGPLGLIPAYQFGGLSSDWVTNLRWHRTNPNVMTAVGTTTAGKLLVSDDGGTTWINKITSWNDQIRGGAGGIPTINVVEMVWTA